MRPISNSYQHTDQFAGQYQDLFISLQQLNQYQGTNCHKLGVRRAYYIQTVLAPEQANFTYKLACAQEPQRHRNTHTSKYYQIRIVYHVPWS